MFLSSAYQRLMQMSSMGAKVFMLSNGDCAAGFGHLSQHSVFLHISLHAGPEKVLPCQVENYGLTLVSCQVMNTFQCLVT